MLKFIFSKVLLKCTQNINVFFCTSSNETLTNEKIKKQRGKNCVSTKGIIIMYLSGV